MIGKKNKKNDKREKEGSKSSGRKMGNWGKKGIKMKEIETIVRFG